MLVDLFCRDRHHGLAVAVRRAEPEHVASAAKDLDHVHDREAVVDVQADHRHVVDVVRDFATAWPDVRRVFGISVRAYCAHGSLGQALVLFLRRLRRDEAGVKDAGVHLDAVGQRGLCGHPVHIWTGAAAPLGLDVAPCEMDLSVYEIVLDLIPLCLVSDVVKQHFAFINLRHLCLSI